MGRFCLWAVGRPSFVICCMVYRVVARLLGMAHLGRLVLACTSTTARIDVSRLLIVSAFIAGDVVSFNMFYFAG